MKRKGIVNGQTIVFDETLGLPEGQQVEVEVSTVEAVGLEQYGFKVIPAGGNVVTREMVNRIVENHRVLGFLCQQPCSFARTRFAVAAHH